MHSFEKFAKFKASKSLKIGPFSAKWSANVRSSWRHRLSSVVVSERRP